MCRSDHFPPPVQPATPSSGPPPDDAVVLQLGNGRWPSTAFDQIARAVVGGTSLNRTGGLEWSKGAPPRPQGLVPRGKHAVDNPLFNAYITERDVVVSDTPPSRGRANRRRCRPKPAVVSHLQTVLRDVFKDAGVEVESIRVAGGGMALVRDEALLHRLRGRELIFGDKKAYLGRNSQCAIYRIPFKVATPNADPEAVRRLVLSGRLARDHSIYLKDVDFAVLCLGVIRDKTEAATALKNALEAAGMLDVRIRDDSKSVGENCVVATCTYNGTMLLRVKWYNRRRGRPSTPALVVMY